MRADGGQQLLLYRVKRRVRVRDEESLHAIETELAIRAIEDFDETIGQDQEQIATRARQVGR